MIKYISTRGNKTHVTFSNAIIKGIAPDGGLFVPEKIPHISNQQLRQLLGKTYQEKAIFLLNEFQTDLTAQTIKKLVHKAYGDNFDTKQIAPVIPLRENQNMLELWHGPTLAFKDMALQLMPHFFSEAVKNKTDKYLILVATSGDTGKAALEGYKNKKKISIMVFYPEGRVSQFQELQMVTQEGNNVSVIALKGDFDDCQRSVKELFADVSFGQELAEKNIVLSSANSINWGRLLPQIVYFFHGYLELVSQKVIKFGDEIDVVVPTGNFGNILAAYYAKRMGLPIKTCVCASNANNVLTDFLRTGTYDITNRHLVKTPSPSMDILIASNIERLLYVLSGDTKKIYEWMNDLKSTGSFTVDAKTKAILQKEFYADWVSNEDSLKNIKHIYKKTNYVMDPHTAVAQLVATRFGSNSPRQMLIISTAHWVKFASDVYQALAGKYIEKKGDEFMIAKEVCRIVSNASLPEQMVSLQQKERLHTRKSIADKVVLEKLIRETFDL